MKINAQLSVDSTRDYSNFCDLRKYLYSFCRGQPIVLQVASPPVWWGNLFASVASCFRRRIYASAAAELCSRRGGVLYEGSCSPPPLGGECVVAGRKKDWVERERKKWRRGTSCSPYTIIHQYTHTGCYKNPSVLVVVAVGGQKKKNPSLWVYEELAKANNSRCGHSSSSSSSYVSHQRDYNSVVEKEWRANT